MSQASRPFIFVLAGVNGAGKSSVGGNLLHEHGLSWFNPDSHARELMTKHGLTLEEANAVAWHFGREQLEDAIATGRNFAFETTLGANTIPALLRKASATHDVVMWYCGLASPELHLQRVKARVASGGHDIPESKIRERWDSSRKNLIHLSPHLAHLQVFDNSAQVAPGQPIPDPVLVMEMVSGELIHPDPTDAEQLSAVPEWAIAVVEAAIQS
ncbi:MAG TPA: zeta toxin family protein [Povalibacter sp.]|uniref:AAA family ATPase n=1 Tax=Povalibacter sp. TaxID=1962978 RepID=UPI002BC9012C|nr:AAA family ATPase [Povalibacter sp.]HMN45881.1 zeta toxin family protein [Povalibacter sp.]